MSSKRGLSAPPPIGTRVRFTGYFLRATGQVTGREGGKRFVVQACACELCGSGGFVAVDEPNLYADDPGASPWRHVAIGNLEIVGAKPKACDQADALPPVKVLR